MAHRPWTREELLVTFNLYFKIPFGKMHSRTPEVIEVSQILNRTPNSIAMRLGNFAHHDPYHIARGINGLSGGANQCQPIWDEYHTNCEDLMFESEQILALLKKESISPIAQEIPLNVVGKEKERLVKTRVNQALFRRIILNTYSTSCAITGINISQLLFASHIKPWSNHIEDRLNPENGICLSATYDTAFDKGLIGIKPNSYEVILSDKIKAFSNEAFYDPYFKSVEGIKIKLPERYEPKSEFLEWHLDNVFGK